MFLDSIWLIPLFPLVGALLMLFFGRKLDPQHAGGHGHDDHGDDDHGHDDHGHGHHGTPTGKLLISILCPGMVLTICSDRMVIIDLSGR